MLLIVCRLKVFILVTLFNYEYYYDKKKIWHGS